MAFFDRNFRPVTAQPRLAQEAFDLERELDVILDGALEGTFPASDPVSSLRVQNA